MDELKQYLVPTGIIQSESPLVKDFAREAIGDVSDPVERAVRLYYRVRDGITYDPYSPFYLPEHYSSEYILKRKRGFCVPKAALLCALGRGAGVPSRIGFATVRNHLTTRQLREQMGSDLFVYHGFTEFFLEGKWVKATPAFNRELCARHKISPMEFNGREDSMFCEFNNEKQRFMEYVEDLGSFQDVPVGTIVQAWKDAYGHERIEAWINLLEQSRSEPARDFSSEDII